VPIFTAAPIGSIQPGYRASLAQGDGGVAQTIALMRQLVDQDLANASFVNFAKSLVQNVPSHDEWGEVEAIYDWVKSNIRFTKDPYPKETLYPPSELLKVRSGDCDDISMLMGALALAVGYPARLVTVAANRQSMGEFSHVYTEIEIPPDSGTWVAADAARPGGQFAAHPPEYFRKRAWSLTDDSYQDLQGVRRHLGYIRYRTLGLGQDDSGDGIDWGSIISQGLTQTPTLVAEASGQPVRVTGPGGVSFQTSPTYNPYSSFMTPYSPGYGVPAAGYNYPLTSTTSGMDWIWPLAIGAVVLMMASK
jgi:hypothetical protein